MLPIWLLDRYWRWKNFRWFKPPWKSPITAILYFADTNQCPNQYGCNIWFVSQISRLTGPDHQIQPFHAYTPHHSTYLLLSVMVDSPLAWFYRHEHHSRRDADGLVGVGINSNFYYSNSSKTNYHTQNWHNQRSVRIWTSFTWCNLKGTFHIHPIQF